MTAAGRTLLVVDDDPDFRELVRLVAGSHGWTVREAENCTRACEILRQERDAVSVILLDYFMPGPAPPQCAADIRGQMGAGTRVVLVTAAVDAAARARALGLSDYLSKPFSLVDLDKYLVGDAIIARECPAS